jgi:hypothetical protein
MPRGDPLPGLPHEKLVAAIAVGLDGALQVTQTRSREDLPGQLLWTQVRKSLSAFISISIQKVHVVTHRDRLPLHLPTPYKRAPLSEELLRPATGVVNVCTHRDLLVVVVAPVEQVPRFKARTLQTVTAPRDRGGRLSLEFTMANPRLQDTAKSLDSMSLAEARDCCTARSSDSRSLTKRREMATQNELAGESGSFSTHEAARSKRPPNGKGIANLSCKGSLA